jgi:hypothetical protein
MLIHLCESALKYQHDNSMVELPPTMCNNIRWGGNPKCLHVFVRKAIWQLEWLRLGCSGWGLKTIMLTFGRYARWHAGNSDGLDESYFDMLPKKT